MLVRNTVLVAALFAALFVACGSSPGPDPSEDAGEALHPDPDGAEPIFTGPLPLSLTAYRHVRDSDGNATIAEGETWLAFHSSGAAFLVVSTDDDGLSYEGTHAEQAGTVSLHFATDGFARDGEFAFDASATRVTLPFKVFSDDPGTSTWERADDAERLPALLFLFFEAATVARNANPDTAIAFAAAHAESLAGTDGNGGTAASSPGPVISRVDRLKNGVRVHYSDPPAGVDPKAPLTVILFSTTRFNGSALSLSPLASDPRVFINQPRPLNAIDDPASRTAVLIAPFYSVKQTDWYDLAYYRMEAPSPAAAGQLEPLGGPMSDWASWLRDDGYSVELLTDGDVDVGGLVRTLAPGAGRPSPGFIFFNTHGGDNLVALGVKLNDKNPRASLSDEYRRTEVLYPDLLTFRGGTRQMPLTLHSFYIKMTRRPNSKRFYLSITPLFWDWLRERQGADFSRSFFYLAACHSADGSDFADPIAARAFFGHSGVASNGLEHALMSYFIRSLERPTHTAEEAFYNILRVQNTGQMIYAEDKILDGKVFTKGSPAFRDANSLAGYGLADGAVFAFREGGWLKSPDTTPGGIWWLLFSARWSKDAETGAQSLLGCWQDFWSKGNAGGLASPVCNAMTPGYVPRQNEVGYASYLLTGSPRVGFDAIQFSRFTLRDGDAP
jgi:hypothetical protein